MTSKKTEPANTTPQDNPDHDGQDAPFRDPNIHGTGLMLDGIGLLIRGESGAGKSMLALELMEEFEVRGREAFLVSDDRIEVGVDNGQLILHAPEAIAGLIELRGRGIVSRPHIKSTRLHLIVDLVGEQIRYLEEDALTTTLCGVVVDRCPIPNRNLIDGFHQRMLIKEAMRSLEMPHKK